MWKKLTNEEGKPIWVNMDLVATVEVFYQGKSMLSFLPLSKDEYDIMVQESPEQIFSSVTSAYPSIR